MYSFLRSGYLSCLLILVVHLSFDLYTATQFDYPTANLSTSWFNGPHLDHSVSFSDGSTVRSILLRGSFGPRFACGFYCNGNCTSYLFAIFIVQTNSGSGIVMPNLGFPQVVWFAKTSSPVTLNTSLALTKEGDLVLRDSNGVKIWSTDTTEKAVVGLNLTETGNLVLYDGTDNIVWESFDHPTDALVPGQQLVDGKKLTARANNIENYTYDLSMTSRGMLVSIDSDPPQTYFERTFVGQRNSFDPAYMKFLNGSLALYVLSSEPNEPDSAISIPLATSMQYMKLESDGHIYVYEWNSGWKVVADILTVEPLGLCGYPLVCGKYGICLNGQCSCPRPVESGGSNYTNDFRQVSARQPSFGCSRVTPLSCNQVDIEYHRLLDLSDITYFRLPEASLNSSDMESCKEICLKNCSCEAVLFRYGTNSSDGSCYMPTPLLSLVNNIQDKTHFNSSAFVKVQVSPSVLNLSNSSTSSSNTTTIVGSSVGATFVLVFIVSVIVFLVKRKIKFDEEKDEEYLDGVPGMPARFTYEELRLATKDFSAKLGQGGFGSVFEGTLVNGTKIAVKCLDGLGQVKKSFVAEVETIGSVHHINLARLVGFCADKSHRLLVYEYMSNGSLEKWIFPKNVEATLKWKTRHRIISDIAKGLAYLHEECRQKIVHLDIKPQNILLDDNFNAKVSDFGLSKLIEKDEEEIMTTMRGTPGYLAPEWLSSVITEKVDVYSFGIVVMEIVCGRKNIDRSQPEESMHLLKLFTEDKGQDIIDKSTDDMLLHREEALQMMKIAAWCLQGDFTRRPLMSVVVKVLEGLMEVESNLDYNFSTNITSSAPIFHKQPKSTDLTLLLPFVLSGPR